MIELTEEFIRVIKPDFRQPIKKIGGLRRFKGEAEEFHCVYFLVSKENEVVYVGQTGNLLQRVGAHQSNKDFSKVYYLLPPSKVEKETKAWRRKHKNYFNSQWVKSPLDRRLVNKPSLRIPEDSPYTIWVNKTEKKFILDYLPRYNNCGMKKKSLSDLAQTYSWLKSNKKNLNKLAELL
jgi:predicted GIY-YIG superfamily endonuclease